MLWAAVFGVALVVAVATPLRAGAADRGAESSQGPRSSQRRCEQCHIIDPAFSHPVGASPSMAVPGHLPLDQGRITCTTCHLQVEHSGAGAGPMLRSNASAGSFCTQCHEPSRASRSKAHASGLERAHLRTGPARLSSGSPTGRLDDESSACVGCHDGAAAGDAGQHSSMTLSAFSAPDKDHPIGVVYKAARAGVGGLGSGAGEIRLVEPRHLDPRIRLFDQSVGCGSCHSVYSRQSELLVMSNQGSRLCLSCHAQ